MQFDNKKIDLTQVTEISDFTVDHYQELLILAKAQWDFAQYDSIPWGSRFILWRHDVDFSLNRSLALAQIENIAGLRATYFINPHSEFYNLAELSQHRIVSNILSLGHDLGLHFDGAFYDIISEKELDYYVFREAQYLKDLFGVVPTAFSFHNPISSNLHCENEIYGGIQNCYSYRLKNEIPYCSDSNGEWRFRRLYDVLEAGTDFSLQVLTHPGWWQDEPMAPRQRVFRSVYGRAKAIMDFSDSSVASFNRTHRSGSENNIQFFQNLDSRLFDLFDFLWNERFFPALFIELWRYHQEQIIRICKAYIIESWGIAEEEVNLFFEELVTQNIDGKIFINNLFIDPSLINYSIKKSDYKKYADIYKLVIRGFPPPNEEILEIGCVYTCELIQAFISWSEQFDVKYEPLVEQNLPPLKITDLFNHESKENLKNDNKVLRNIQKDLWNKYRLELLLNVDSK